MVQDAAAYGAAAACAHLTMSAAPADTAWSFTTQHSKIFDSMSLYCSHVWASARRWKMTSMRLYNRRRLVICRPTEMVTSCAFLRSDGTHLNNGGEAKAPKCQRQRQLPDEHDDCLF